MPVLRRERVHRLELREAFASSRGFVAVLASLLLIRKISPISPRNARLSIPSRPSILFVKRDLEAMAIL